MTADPRVLDRDWARREGMVAFAGYPLMIGEELVGVLAMFARHPLAPEDLNALASVARGISLGIARWRRMGVVCARAKHERSSAPAPWRARPPP